MADKDLAINTDECSQTEESSHEDWATEPSPDDWVAEPSPEDRAAESAPEDQAAESLSDDWLNGPPPDDWAAESSPEDQAALLHSDHSDVDEQEVEKPVRSTPDVIICVDTSSSTEGCNDYYNYINTIVSDAKNEYEDVRIISWNTDAYETYIEYLEPDGGTQPISFLRCLQSVETKYHLIVTTDGEIFDREVNACNEILMNSSILSNILSFKMYYIGNVYNMNLRLSDLFINIEDKRIFINDQEPIKIMNIDIDKLQYNDFVNNVDIIASILELIKVKPDRKKDLRVQLCRSNARILAEIAKHSSIKEYFENDDVIGCVDFVKEFDPSDKTRFQSVMSKLIQFCTEENDEDDDNVDLYSLSHLVNAESCRETIVIGDCDSVEYTPAENADEVEDTPAENADEVEDTPAENADEVEDTPAENADEVDGTPAENADEVEGTPAENADEVEFSENLNDSEQNPTHNESDCDEDSEETDEEDVLTCNITMLKSYNPCAEIVSLKNNEDKILSDEESKLISQKPWLILNKQEIIDRIVKHVGNYTYDLITKNRMDEAYTCYTSAFTRQEVYGVFIFHCNSPNVDYNLVFRNNNRALSFIFNKDYKLPGNKSIWNVLFLYILGKYHPFWKQHSKIIHEELINILPRLSSFITLNPFVNPPVIDRLDVSLWYVINVSHRAFPNSSKNILRFVEGSERLIELYEYIYPSYDVSDIKFKVKVWNFWKLLVRIRTSKKLRLKVFSPYQNREIVYGNIVELLGISSKPSLDFIPLFIKNLFDYFFSKSKPTIFDRIPFDDLDEDMTIPAVDINSLERVNCIKTYLLTSRPFRLCPIYKFVWKDCAGKYDIRKDSFFVSFIKFCGKFKRYPETVDEFLIFHNNQYNFSRKAGDCVVYVANVKKCFEVIMKRCYGVMLTYSPKDVISTYKRNYKIYNVLEN